MRTATVGPCWLTDDVRCVAHVCCQSGRLHHDVGHSDGLLRARHHWHHLLRGDRGHTGLSCGAPERPWLGEEGLGLCPCRKAVVGPFISSSISPVPALSLTPTWSLHSRPKGSAPSLKRHWPPWAERRALSTLVEKGSRGRWPHQPQPGEQGKEPQVHVTGGLPGGKGTTGRGWGRAQGQSETGVSPATSGPLPVMT